VVQAPIDVTAAVARIRLRPVRRGSVFLRSADASVTLQSIITMNWHMFIANSPAIDAINDGTCPPPTRDQRGVKRLKDGNGNGGPACDIDAYEYVP